ncbi:MAG: hypothetical protein RXS42_08715 [Nitrososphaeria archaeon]
MSNSKGRSGARSGWSLIRYTSFWILRRSSNASVRISRPRAA